jgi:hypothetical protein
MLSVSTGAPCARTILAAVATAFGIRAAHPRIRKTVAQLLPEHPVDHEIAA